MLPAPSLPEVLADPRAEVRLLGFGDNALNFELLVWCKDPPGHARLKSDLYYHIEANLRRAGTEIPFPQRTLHVSADEVADVIERVQESRPTAPFHNYGDVSTSVPPPLVWRRASRPRRLRSGRQARSARPRPGRPLQSRGRDPPRDTSQ